MTLDRGCDQFGPFVMPAATIKLFLPTGDPLGLKVAGSFPTGTAKCWRILALMCRLPG